MCWPQVNFIPERTHCLGLHLRLACAIATIAAQVLRLHGIGGLRCPSRTCAEKRIGSSRLVRIFGMQRGNLLTYTVPWKVPEAGVACEHPNHLIQEQALWETSGSAYHFGAVGSAYRATMLATALETASTLAPAGGPTKCRIPLVNGIDLRPGGAPNSLLVVVAQHGDLLVRRLH
jgi:hypothetical protein